MNNNILLTNNYIIFKGNNLSEARDWEWMSPGHWGAKYENETDPDPSKHTRWVFVTSDYDQQDFIVDQGGVTRWGYWNHHDSKVHKKTKDTYLMKADLKNVFERVLEDNDLGDRITFWRGVLSDARQDNIENLWFIAEKEYLKEVIDIMTALTSLQTRIDRNGVAQEVIFIKNNFAEVERFIQEKGEVVEGNEPNQNNTGNNTRTPAGGEIMTDVEYNNLVDQHAADRSIINRYNELWNKMHEKYQEYERTKGSLLREINEKSSEVIDPDTGRMVSGDLWQGRKITAADSEASKNNLKALAQKWLKGGLNDMMIAKKIEVVELMEELVGEGEENDTQNNNPPPTETPNTPNISAFRQEAINTIEVALNLEPKIANNDLDEGYRQWESQINAANEEKDIDNIKDRVLVDIKAKRKAKKDAANIANNLSTDGKDAEALKKQLEEVEKAKGQQSYEDNQSAIDNLKNELAKKVSYEEYRQVIVETIKKTLTKYNIDANELDSESKEDWEKLKNGEITDPNQVNEIEKKVVKNAGEKGSQKKLTLIFSESQQDLKSGKAAEIKKAKNKLNNFMVSTDIYEKYLFSQREAEAKALLKELENYSSQKTTNSPSKFPWVVIVPVGMVLLIIVGAGMVIYRKRKKKRLKRHM
ncbi:protein of unknown function [endosymbiont DhMRE of Dentiscutata heterogama]|uniref:hypothetical protein n=1 Tax=endosymbiont DhMRE of Dentiscutata heterogama TaxID=1609546 RepID=UPI000629D7AA|nr:hypothetical protein [endosymbiont DhMRE of Dentiscutata heterogama]CFW93194.1 protein of unknown function [endosymbiont DhMRE of Dentiscutata heterogama]